MRSKFKRTRKKIIITGVFLSFIGYFLINKMYALGVLVGLPVSIFNLWLLTSTVGNIKDTDPIKAHNRFMLRALIRMLISFSVLLISVSWGIYFMFGVATGLILQMLTYLQEAVKLLVGKG